MDLETGDGDEITYCQITPWLIKTYLKVAASPRESGNDVDMPYASPWIHSVPHQYVPIPSLEIGGTGPPSPPPPPRVICCTSSDTFSLFTKSSTLVFKGSDVFLNGKSGRFNFNELEGLYAIQTKLMTIVWVKSKRQKLCANIIAFIFSTSTILFWSHDEHMMFQNVRLFLYGSA